MQGPHPELQEVRRHLTEIHDGIAQFKPLTARPPICDASFEDAAQSSEVTEQNQWLHQESVPGLRKLKESIRIDLGVLDKVIYTYLCILESSHLILCSTSSSSSTIRNAPTGLHCRQMRRISLQCGMRCFARHHPQSLFSRHSRCNLCRNLRRIRRNCTQRPRRKMTRAIRLELK